MSRNVLSRNVEVKKVLYPEADDFQNSISFCLSAAIRLWKKIDIDQQTDRDEIIIYIQQITDIHNKALNNESKMMLYCSPNTPKRLTFRLSIFNRQSKQISVKFQRVIK